MAIGAHPVIVISRRLFSMASLAIHQALVVHRCIIPVCGIVAPCTLAAIVLHRRVMAGSAICQATVIYEDTTPTARVMTPATAVAVVSIRRVMLVAAHTVGKTCMVEPGIAPVLGVVAVGALPTIVIVPAMAACTVCQALVTECDILPILSVMTISTGTDIVIIRRLVSVTILAIGQAGMVKVIVLPVLGVVAIGALPSIVSLGCIARRVTGLAVGEIGVIEPIGLPIAVIVTLGTLAGIVHLQFAVRQVARYAVRPACMIKSNVVPILTAGMTVDASIGILFDRKQRGLPLRWTLGPPGGKPQCIVAANIVIGRTVLQVAGATLGDALVVVLDQRPITSLVAGGAQAFVMVIGVIYQVAGFAVGEAKVIKHSPLPVLSAEVTRCATICSRILRQGFVPNVQYILRQLRQKGPIVIPPHIVIHRAVIEVT